MGKGSVIRQKKQAGRILVKPPDRKKAPPLPFIRHGVYDRRLARVARGRQHAGRLIEHDIDMSRPVDRLAVNGERDGFRVELRRGSAHGVPFTAARPRRMISRA